MEERRTFYSLDYIAVNLHAVGEVDPSLRSYAVLVGSIWLPV